MDLSQLSDQQMSTLKQFRESIKDCKLHDDRDIYLLRWLIARDFDLPRAEKMLRNSLEWRRQYRVDMIREENKSPEAMVKYFPAAPVGQDRLFHPLWVVRYGMEDFRGLLYSVKKRDYLRHVISLVETSIWLGKNYPEPRQPKPNSLVQSTIIFDMEGFSIRHITYKPVMNMATLIVQLYEANYPELLRRVFVVNAPKIFSVAFAMLKPFLHERTTNKIFIFGHDPEEWKAAILADVDADQLPVCYGGNMTDPDGNPNCITKCNMGGPVPKSYYLTNQPKSEIANKKGLTLSPGSKEQLEFEINLPNSVLRWEFYSETSDVAFAVYRKVGKETIPVIPYGRVDCHITTEEGELRCEETGTYIAEFDNSYSYMRSKKIWYSITIDTKSSPSPTLDVHVKNGIILTN